MISETKCYAARSAKVGNTTLCSSRKQGNTLTYWYWIKDGRYWMEFDVRDLASAANLPVPPLMNRADLDAVFAGTQELEGILKRDLQRVAEFCAGFDALNLIKQQQNPDDDSPF